MREIEIKLKQVLKSREMEQKELAELTGLSNRTISELANNKTERIPKNAIAKIAEVLDITDINELITIVKVDSND